MDILVIGGTGAMGVPLVNILSKSNKVFVTSRSQRKSQGNICYIQGNGKEPSFIKELLREKKYDCIIDFLVRSESELKCILEDFLNNTGQYIFISSARVYSQTNDLITETTSRLLDVSVDREFLSTREYSLEKAREENLLLYSPHKNWTIIRPSITYNTYRLQLGVYEKEEWLFRALHDRSIVFSEDLKDKITTMTHGDDVAAGIAAVVGKTNALGRVFHITSPRSLPWQKVLEIYVMAIEKKTGKKVKVVYTPRSTNFLFPGKEYQLKYCRYFNRSFDNSAIAEFIDPVTFKSPEDGLTECLNKFLDKQRFDTINGAIEAVHDSITGEKTPLSELGSMNSKVSYILQKAHLGKLLPVIKKTLKHFIK